MSHPFSTPTHPIGPFSPHHWAWVGPSRTRSCCWRVLWMCHLIPKVPVGAWRTSMLASVTVVVNWQEARLFCTMWVTHTCRHTKVTPFFETEFTFLSLHYSPIRIQTDCNNDLTYFYCLNAFLIRLFVYLRPRSQVLCNTVQCSSDLKSMRLLTFGSTIHPESSDNKWTALSPSIHTCHSMYPDMCLKWPLWSGLSYLLCMQIFYFFTFRMLLILI